MDFCTGQSLGVLTGEQLLFRKTGNKDVLKKEINLISFFKWVKKPGTG